MFKKLKQIDRLTIFFSILAFIVSICGIYFQFFNKRHRILYATLEPKYFDSKKTISIPVIFKNVGNQAEVVLNSSLNLQSREDSNSSFSRISEQSPQGFPIILGPNESKLVSITGNYGDYLLGRFDISENKELIYHSVKVLDSLRLFLNTSYIAVSGRVADHNKDIGYITFDDKKNIKRIYCFPIDLRRLPMHNNEKHIIWFTLKQENNHVYYTNNPYDTNSIKYNENKIQLINKLLRDSILR
jgi:hypothetical protein